MKYILKNIIFRFRKNIIVDRYSELNYNVVNLANISDFPCRIVDSRCSIKVMGEGCVISQSECYGDIYLGKFVTITGPGTVVKSLKEKILIGSYSSIGQNVCIVDFNHQVDKVSSCFLNHLLFGKGYLYDIKTKGEVIIEEDVWIGSNSVILPGIRIGRGAVIGAGSVVTKDVPRYSIVHGSPAKVYAMRFDDNIIQVLEELRWWEWGTNKIEQNKKFFNYDLKSMSFSELKNMVQQIDYE